MFFLFSPVDCLLYCRSLILSWKTAPHLSRGRLKECLRRIGFHLVDFGPMLAEKEEEGGLGSDISTKIMDCFQQVREGTMFFVCGSSVECTAMDVLLTSPIPFPGHAHGLGMGPSMTCPIHSHPHRVLYSAVNQMPSYSFIFLASSFHIRYIGKLVTSKDLYLQSMGKEVQVDWSHFIPQHSKEPGARTVRRCREIYL